MQSCAAGNRSNNHEMISFGTVRKEMGMKTFDIEQYSRRIVESKPSQRVSWLIDATRENMLVKNEKAPDPPSVLNEKTGKLPVIIRKAMAERAKLSCAPVGIWDKQVFAGCFTLRE